MQKYDLICLLLPSMGLSLTLHQSSFSKTHGEENSGELVLIFLLARVVSSALTPSHYIPVLLEKRTLPKYISIFCIAQLLYPVSTVMRLCQIDGGSTAVECAMFQRFHQWKGMVLCRRSAF